MFFYYYCVYFYDIKFRALNNNFCTITNQTHSITICNCTIYCKILQLIAKFAINCKIIRRNIVHFVAYGIKNFSFMFLLLFI